MKRIIGLIVNPVAGMGGSVGLKGTDGLMHKRALELGAKPVTPKRTDEVVCHIKKKDSITLVVAPGKMGERYIRDCDLPFKVIGAIGADTSNEDTKRNTLDPHWWQWVHFRPRQQAVHPGSDKTRQEGKHYGGRNQR